MHESAKRRLVADLAEGNRRSARSIECPRCGAPCIRGDDHDDVALIVTVDAEPLDPAGEMLTHLDGRTTYDLIRARGKTAPPRSSVLYHREPWHLISRKAPPGTVHAEHRCTERHRA